jgi:hypothetical protein
MTSTTAEPRTTRRPTPKRPVLLLIAALIGLGGIGATAGMALGAVGAASAEHPGPRLSGPGQSGPGQSGPGQPEVDHHHDRGPRPDPRVQP